MREGRFRYCANSSVCGPTTAGGAVGVLEEMWVRMNGLYCESSVDPGRDALRLMCCIYKMIKTVFWGLEKASKN